MIGHISFDDISPSLFLNFSDTGHTRVLVKIDYRSTQENAGSRSAFSCFFTRRKITVSEGEQF